MFLAIYSLEFLLKVYAEPIGYWLSAYNIFDFVVLVISGVQVNCILQVDTSASESKRNTSLEGAFTLRESERESDIALRWLIRKFSVLR